jgi:hypothetical protein
MHLWDLLRDVVAVTAALTAADPALATRVAPATGAFVHADATLRARAAGDGWGRRAGGDALAGVHHAVLVPVDRDKVPAEVVLARERTRAGPVRAHVRLGPVRVVRGHVRLQVESTGECYERGQYRRLQRLVDAGHLHRGQFGHLYLRRGSSSTSSAWT